MFFNNASTPMLLVSGFEEDHRRIQDFFCHSNWRLLSAPSGEEAWRCLHQEDVGVVLTEAELPGGFSWRDLTAEMNEMVDAPAVIVTSRSADDLLWAEVLNLGGYDLLMKPFDRREVLCVVSQAWRYARDRRRRRASGAPTVPA
jgi:DNA-binding response OmpR family regulator